MTLKQESIKTQVVQGDVLQATVNIIVAARMLVARAPAKPHTVRVLVPAHSVEELRKALREYDDLP